MAVMGGGQHWCRPPPLGLVHVRPGVDQDTNLEGGERTKETMKEKRRESGVRESTERASRERFISPH
jgi:hypothetical protein